MTHWVDAYFLSIVGGHVFNQIQPIYRQRPNWDIPQIEIENSSVMWTGIIGSNSKLVNRFIIPYLSRIDDKQVQDMLAGMANIKERIVSTIWVKK